MGMDYLPIPQSSPGFLRVYTPMGRGSGCRERLSWGHPPIPIHEAYNIQISLTPSLGLKLGRG